MDPLQKLVAPPGLQKLIEQCAQIYPDQPNPLQVTTVLKYWLGGQDPLDYISMYNNAGDAAQNIPPHWHYISYGLSDLHGDGRVHQPDITPNGEVRSGMGFELSFRLVKSKTSVDPKNPERPPTWPANLLQALARYVFQTGNRLCAGDNVPWRKSLDNSSSCIQHMLITTDPQLRRTLTPFGWVDFCQIVGVTEAELEQASRWNGNGVINLLKNDPSTGGKWLITNMSRSQSVFELFPQTLVQLEQDLETEGSDLAGVNAEFTIHEVPKAKIKMEQDLDEAIGKCTIDEKASDAVKVKNEEPDLDHGTNNSFSNMSDSGSLTMGCPVEQHRVQSQMIRLEGLHMTLAPYAAKYLLMAIKDRIRHGRHFTFKCQNRALTFVSESVSGSAVTKEAPYGVMGYWTQVLIADDLVPQMINVFRELALGPDKFELPKHFEWPDRNLKIVIDTPAPQQSFFA